jgi:hypothetical protein
VLLVVGLAALLTIPAVIHRPAASRSR